MPLAKIHVIEGRYDEAGCGVSTLKDSGEGYGSADETTPSRCAVQRLRRASACPI